MRMSLCSDFFFSFLSLKFIMGLWFFADVAIRARIGSWQVTNSVADSDTHPLKSVSVQIAAIEDMVCIHRSPEQIFSRLNAFRQGTRSRTNRISFLFWSQKKSSLLLTQFRTRTFIDINLAERFHNLQSPSIGKIKRSITRSVDENGIQFGLVCSINLFDVVAEEQNLLGLPLYR